MSKEDSEGYEAAKKKMLGEAENKVAMPEPEAPKAKQTNSKKRKWRK